jgi:alcohol/geraniol dehydrogenase (NADP+)
LQRCLIFTERHTITAQVEHVPMSCVNDARERQRGGKARYRIVLDADFA